jgi:hypothetical protein
MRAPLMLSLLSAVATLASSCGTTPATPPPPAQTTAPVATAAPAPSPSTFVNRVWRASDSSARASDQLYVFLSEGTLVVASSTGTPALGRWSRAGDGLIMVEEGQSHPTDIVSLTADEFHIRSHNPGQPVDIRLVPADREPPGGTR